MIYSSRLIDGKIVKEDFSSGFDLECDVLCVGAGCAGVYCADAASREGARVILAENDVSVGGMHVLGNVKGYYYGGVGGSFEADDEICRADKSYHLSAYIAKKQATEIKRLKKSGVKLLTEHTPTALIFNGERVVGAAFFDGDKEIFIKARITVDSTSDGHLIRMCEAEKSYGRDFDGRCAPFSVFATYMKDGKCTRVNRDSGHINPYDTEDFSKRIILAHKGVSDCLSLGEFLNIAAHTGVREGVRFVGEDTLSYEDVLLKRIPERVLFYAYSDFDRHGYDHALDEELLQNFWVISNLSTVTARIPVPFGAVIPKGIKGLVTAGRCMSADTYVGGAVRMIRDMFRMGECVGTAAAIACAACVDFSEIDYPLYEKKVRELGCFAGDESRDFGFAYPKVGMPYTPISFNFEENFHLLKTETPGVAFWSAFLSDDDSISERLSSLLEKEKCELYRYNLGIALGIMSDVRALPTLREIVDKRDCFYFKDSRRSNQFRSAIASCLIGRLGDKTDIPRLSEIVFSSDEHKKAMYHTLPPDYLYYKANDLNFVYFNMFTYSAMALVNIYKREEMPMDGLSEKFQALLDSGEAIDRMVNATEGHGNAYDEVTGFLKQIIRLTKEP